MNLVAAVICFALIEYILFSLAVGRARAQHKVAPPATTGNEAFERIFRVHQNTLELLIVFIPAIWFFGLYVSPIWAAGLGVVFIIGRALYFVGYASEAKKRLPGFGLSFLSMVALVIGALIGAVLESF